MLSWCNRLPPLLPTHCLVRVAGILVFFAILGFNAQLLQDRWSSNSAWVAVVHWAAATDSTNADRAVPQALIALDWLGQTVSDALHQERINHLTLVARAFAARATSREASRQAHDSLAYADHLRGTGQCSEAMPYYNTLISGSAYRVEAALGAYLCARTTSDQAAMQKFRAVLSSLEPSRAIGQANQSNQWVAQSTLPVNATWEFLGFDVLDEESVTFDLPLPVIYYWRHSGGAGADFRMINAGPWRLYQIGNRLYQIGAVSNLVSNAGIEQPFAQPSGSQPLIPGWLGGIYSSTPFQTVDVVLTTRESKSTLALRLWNTAGGPSGKAVWGMPVTAGELFIFGVDLRQSWGSSACTAFAFDPPRSDSAGSPDIQWLDCPASDVPRPWRQVATLLRARSDSTMLSVFLINYGPGIAEFDNVLLIPLISPDHLWEQPP